jgi:hypothetical protein
MARTLFTSCGPNLTASFFISDTPGRMFEAIRNGLVAGRQWEFAVRRALQHFQRSHRMGHCASATVLIVGMAAHAGGETVLDNAYVRVSRNTMHCPTGTIPGCGKRVMVALGDLVLSVNDSQRVMARGDVVVVGPTQSYRAPSKSEFVEVVVKPDHPPPGAPAEIIAAEKNVMRYEGEDFMVFEEQLEPGDTRARHSHSHRVVIQLNRTQLEQWPDGAASIIVETSPDRPLFNPPVIHRVKNIGAAPLRGVIIEFKPMF